MSIEIHLEYYGTSWTDATDTIILKKGERNMAYNKSDWKSGDIISSSKLNNIETGIYDSVIDNKNGTITVNGDIIDVQSLLNINLDDYYTKEQVDQELPLKPGPKGTSITGISQTYQLSDSETIAPTGTWTTAIQTPTDELPYLWVQNIFLTNDSSNIVLTYVCPIGKTGATGPQGETGQGLDIKGYYESSSSLPTTGNNGDCYIIGYDLYVYMNGSYTDVGALTADSSNFVDVTTLNAGLATKVTDNKNGTEQLNGVQVQPFNKLSDTIGGVNYIKDGNFPKFTPNWAMGNYSDIAEIISDDTSGKNYYHWRAKSGAPYTGPSQAIQQAFSQGDQLTVTLTAHADQATNMLIYIHELDANGNTMASGNYNDTVNLTATDSLITWHRTIQNDCDSLWIQFSSGPTLTNDYYITNVQLEKSSVASGFRNSQSDFLSNQLNGNLPSNTDLNTITTSGYYQIINIPLVNFADSASHWGYLQVTYLGGIIVQKFFTNSSGFYQRVRSGSPATWSDWLNVGAPIPKGDTGENGKDAVINVVSQAQYDALADKSGVYFIEG